MLTQARNDGAIGLVLFALPRLALADLSAGNWTGAVTHATEALELARSTGQHGLTAMPLAQLALVGRAARRPRPTTVCWPNWIASPPGSRPGSSGC